jgi:hypothetical protein
LVLTSQSWQSNLRCICDTRYQPPSSTSFETGSAAAAVAAAGIASSNQEILQEQKAQAMNTDNDALL